MPRTLVLVLLTIALAACGASGVTVEPETHGSMPADPTLPSATPAPSGSAEPTATPTARDGHPADGLTVVRPLDDDNPTTQVWVIESDGTPRRVTGVSGQLGASHPVWSRDGEQLAFSGSKVGEVGIGGLVGLVHADGSNEREVGAGQTPQWSPDGTRIAFVEVDDVTGEDLSMYVVDVAEGEITDLGLGYSPRWIDDGTLVFNANVLAADGSVTSDAFVLDLETGERQPLGTATTAYPSPDGSMLLLEHDGAISLASPDGSGAVELLNGFSPVWSPDGTLFAFAYDFDSNANPVHAIVDLEGSPVTSDVRGSSLTWSPDGTRVAVEVYVTPSPVVHVIDVATGEILWEEVGVQPAWRPD